MVASLFQEVKESSIDEKLLKLRDCCDKEKRDIELPFSFSQKI